MTQEAWRPSEKPAVFRYHYADGSTEFVEVDVRGQLDAFVHDVPWRTDEYFTAAQLAAEVARAVAAEREAIAAFVAKQAAEHLVNGNYHSARRQRVAALAWIADAIRKAQP